MGSILRFGLSHLCVRHVCSTGALWLMACHALPFHRWSDRGASVVGGHERISGRVVSAFDWLSAYRGQNTRTPVASRPLLAVMAGAEFQETGALWTGDQRLRAIDSPDTEFVDSIASVDVPAPQFSRDSRCKNVAIRLK